MADSLPLFTQFGCKYLNTEQKSKITKTVYVQLFMDLTNIHCRIL